MRDSHFRPYIQGEFPLRIRRITIGQWRHFSNIEINLEEQAPLVCVVGANGTGKSHILELIAACANRLGLTQGVQLARGEVFNDPHDVELQFYVAKGVSDAVDVELRQGLFLIDEPELHLNADLIRTWVGYLLTTVQEGQIWLATHSLEAVEAAGQQATFVLERGGENKKVDRIARLNERPVLAALSRSVGTPAFSISQLLFVYIEGEDGIGEREHYQKLSALGQKVRFIEAGAGTEVSRRVTVIKSLASGVETGIRITSIVDRDYKSQSDIAALEKLGVFVLPVHEAENFHLHPALGVLLRQNGKEPDAALPCRSIGGTAEP